MHGSVVESLNQTLSVHDIKLRFQIAYHNTGITRPFRNVCNAERLHRRLNVPVKGRVQFNSRPGQRLKSRPPGRQPQIHSTALISQKCNLYVNNKEVCIGNHTVSGSIWNKFEIVYFALDSEMHEQNCIYSICIYSTVSSFEVSSVQLRKRTVFKSARI